MTVARNKVIDHHRQASRRRFFSLDKAENILAGEEKMPEEVVVREEELDRLRSYLQSLPATQQEVLQLRFTGGLRCAEIASMLNKREGAIRTINECSAHHQAGFLLILFRCHFSDL